MFWHSRKRLDEEVDAHIASEIADNIARGMNPIAAREAALRTFGNIESAKENARELSPLYWLDTFAQDMRFAFRQMARTPWISTVIIATLTIGIALNVSAFTVLNGLLLRPSVRHEPETFVNIIPRYSGQYVLRYSDGGLSQPDYVYYRDTAKSLQSLAAYRLANLTLSGAGTGSVRTALVSCNFADVLNHGAPIAGRYFSPSDCTGPMQPAPVVLSESLWRGRFNSDSGVLGRVVYLNRVAFLVVGIAPNMIVSPEPDRASDLWIPYSMLGSVRPADDYFSDTKAHWLNIIGRRNRDASMEHVRQELNALAAGADAGSPGRSTSLIVTNGAMVQDPEMRPRVRLIFTASLGAATLLLLLACVNVTTLLLARSAARQREIAVRLSLGAGRFRLLRQLLTESLVLSGIAAALSFLIAQRAPEILWRSLIGAEPPFHLGADWRVLLYCIGTALIAAVVAGLSPAIESLRPQLSESLKGSSTATTAGHRRSRLRSVLVAVQVALSLVLLVQVSLFMRAQQRFFSHEPGFETKQVLNVTLSSILQGYVPPVSFYQDLESRVRALPGVEVTSYASIAPWFGRNSTRLMDIDGEPLPDNRDYRKDPARRLVRPEYFSALNLAITRGRAFTHAELAAEAQVQPVVISDAMAQRYWPGVDPIGHQFRTNVIHQVIGVARDVQSIRYMQEDGPFYYSPLYTEKFKPPYLMVRVAGDPDTTASAIRDILRQMDPQMAIGITTLASQIERQADRFKPVLTYGAATGLLALGLALTGVYAVVSFSVSQRVREIGIRVALGAKRGDVISLVLRSGATPVFGGLVIGIGLALLAAKSIESMLFGLDPRDPLTLTVVPVLLCAAALGAIWIPARRAAVLDPVTAIRHE